MYNFDEIIDRRHTNAMKTDGFRDYIFHADETMKFPYQDEEFIRFADILNHLKQSRDNTVGHYQFFAVECPVVFAPI